MTQADPRRLADLWSHKTSMFHLLNIKSGSIPQLRNMSSSLSTQLFLSVTQCTSEFLMYSGLHVPYCSSLFLTIPSCSSVYLRIHQCLIVPQFFLVLFSVPQPFLVFLPECFSVLYLSVSQCSNSYLSIPQCPSAFLNLPGSQSCMKRFRSAVRLSRVTAAEVCVIKEEAVERFLPQKPPNSSLVGDRTHVEKSSQ